MTARNRRPSLAAAYDSRAEQDTDRPVLGVTAGVTADRSTPYRLSVSVPPATYTRVREWMAKASSKLGRRVDLSKVGDALFAELLADDELATRVLARVREQMRK